MAPGKRDSGGVSRSRSSFASCVRSRPSSAASRAKGGNCSRRKRADRSGASKSEWRCWRGESERLSRHLRKERALGEHKLTMILTETEKQAALIGRRFAFAHFTEVDL